MQIKAYIAILPIKVCMFTDLFEICRNKYIHEPT